MVFQFWVSQGNKWCDFCKIYISNNPSSIRNHELGQRHKDNVGKRLTAMRQEKTAKDKELKEATRALEQIEAVSYDSFAFTLLVYLHLILVFYLTNATYFLLNNVKSPTMYLSKPPCTQKYVCNCGKCFENTISEVILVSWLDFQIMVNSYCIILP